MSKNHVPMLGVLIFVCLVPRAIGQANIEFARDVQSIFKTNCVGCHGPSQQMAGMRLDQRSSAMKAGTRRIVPGGSANSFVYLKLVGQAIGGLPMPPTGPLRPEQIDIIKTWIDQGADWPDALSGDVPPPPFDPGATRIMAAVRDADRHSFAKLLAENATSANRQGTGGSTPLIYAALYGDVESVRLLLDHGASANGRTEGGTTPLAAAAGRYASNAIVTLLLDHGATPDGEALQRAAYAGNESVFRMLVEHGADIKRNAAIALTWALRSNCAGCFDMALAAADRNALNVALVTLASFGNTARLATLLDRGADVNARVTGIRRDVDSRTALMLAANSQLIPTSAIQLLIDRGADVNATGPQGETALDLADRSGETAVVTLLKKSGAKEGGAFRRAAVTPTPSAGLQAALEKSIALLQRSEVVSKAGCVSCHNDSFTLMTVATARDHGLRVDEQGASQHLKRVEQHINAIRDDVLQGADTCEVPEIDAYILVGLAAQQYPPSSATDAMALCLKMRQSPDGSWRTGLFDLRPPMQSTDITLTGPAIRALQVYGQKTRQAEYQAAVRQAAAWLMRANPSTNDERVSQLLGVKWAGISMRNAVARRSARELLALQRADGGWAQIPTLASDAYATGQALYALKECGALTVTDAAYQRGVQFLLATQLDDGSWYVRSRSIPLQPYFESGFPHGPDQWVSAAATNWAVMALAPAAPRRLTR